MTAVSPLSQPRLPFTLRRVLAAMLIALAGVAATRVEGATTPMPGATEISELIRSVMPAEWSIQQTQADVVPAGWFSPETSAVTVRVSDGRSTHTLAFVPRDWVGVQQRGTTPQVVRYGDKAKVILDSDSSERLTWLAQIAPHDASLASPDSSTAFFVGQYPRVEAGIRALIRASKSPREQVVASFIALGVPAEDMIREAALSSRHPARLAATRSLRHFPGKATREALLKIIADRSKEASADKCRFAALDACASLLIEGHGPAVHAALQAEKDEPTAVRLADELNRLRYAQAAPDLRRWLKSAQSLDSKVSFARALATVRDTSSVAEIRHALTAPAGRRASVSQSTDAAARHELEIELFRLTGTWGQQQRGVRLAVEMKSPDRVRLHIENMSDGPFLFIPFSPESGESWPVGLEIKVDGRAISPPGPRDQDLGKTADIVRSIAPGTAACFELDVSSSLPNGGEHTLSASWFELAAAEITIQTSATLASQAPPAS